jgi:hypothetical protein
MQRLTLMLALLSAAVLNSPASLKAAVISFDELNSGEDVGAFYNGGFGSMGSGPGPSLGVTFGSGWIVSPPDAYGGAGNSADVPAGGLIDIAGGWSGPVSFYYMGGPLVVDFHSLPGGGGSVVFSLNLPADASFQAAGDIVPLFQSIVFTTSGARIDQLTQGGLVIPEPGAAQLVLAGLLLLIAAARRSGRGAFMRC